MARKKAYEEKIVKLVLIKEGIYDLEKTLIIKCPISIHGAGQDKTIIQGNCIQIHGPKKEKKRVNMQGMTMKIKKIYMYDKKDKQLNLILELFSVSFKVYGSYMYVYF